MKKHSGPYTVPYDYAFDLADFPLAIKPSFDRPSPGLHDHERFWEIVLVLSGEAVYRCEDKKYTIRSQELLVTLPGMFHNYESMDVDYYNVLVDFDALKLPLFDLAETRGYQKLFVQGPRSHLEPGAVPVRNFLNVEQYSQAFALLKRMHDLQSRREPGYRAAMAAAFTEFLGVICRAGEAEGSETPTASRPYTIAELALYMTRQCQEAWPVERLCKVSHLSRSALFREFRKYCHASPNQFLTRQRLRKACALLQSSELSIEAVATRCGFANGSYLATVFTKTFGMTPLRYRRKPREKA